MSFFGNNNSGDGGNHHDHHHHLFHGSYGAFSPSGGEKEEVFDGFDDEVDAASGVKETHKRFASFFRG